jgi:hypothetical protein
MPSITMGSMIKSKFNLVVVTPPQLRETLFGVFRDVMETIQWGLIELGYEATISINDIAKDRTNIVFAFHMLSESELDTLPSDTIIYNMEQLGGRASLRPTFAAAARKLQIWEYSRGNLGHWAAMKPVAPVACVPIGWAPILERIPRDVPQDIDVLFYGYMTPERLQIFQTIGHMRTIFATNVFGSVRDGLIARAKIVLNISAHGYPHIFATVRTSYAIANAKAVVTDRMLGSFIEDDLAEAVMFAKPKHIADACMELLASDSKRRELEIRGQEAMRRRDIRNILRSVLSGTEATPTLMAPRQQ